MPELPEVETITNGLIPYLGGSKVVSSRTSGLRLRDPIPIKLIKKNLTNQKFEKVWRRSKYIVFEGQQWSMFIHLGMTGNLLLRDESADQFPHTHLVLGIEKNGTDNVFLHYVDPRRFGRIVVCQTNELQSHPLLASLGPEPLEQKTLGDYLWKTSRGSKRPIKNFIMDSHVVVGVGNIYAAESLFTSGIDPRRHANELGKQEFARLSKEIKKTLKRAIRAGGTSFRDFKNLDGKPGYFAISLKVYGRKGETCPNCESPIEVIKQTGRSTFFCPTCQT